MSNEEARARRYEPDRTLQVIGWAGIEADQIYVDYSKDHSCSLSFLTTHMSFDTPTLLRYIDSTKKRPQRI